MGHSKGPEQPQSSSMPLCHSHAMASARRELATIRTAAYRSSPRYALRHGRRRKLISLVVTKSHVRYQLIELGVVG